MSTDYWNWETTSRGRSTPFFDMARAAKRAIKGYSERMAKRRRMRAEKELLMSMPDHMLKDIGISRSQIDPALHQGRESDKIRTIGRLRG